MVEFDAFASGIEFGGLRSMFNIKLLICYILKSVKVPMTRTQICDAMQKTGLVNFFDLNSALDELLENKVVLEKIVADEPHLVVSAIGGYSAAELEKNLLPGIREKAVKTALNIIARTRSEKENDVFIEKTDDGCNVTMQIKAGGDVIMSLTLNVADNLQAEQLKEGFLNAPAELYADIIERLTGEKFN